MYAVHKRTDSGPEIAFNNFVKIPEVTFIILSFRMYYIQTISFSIGLTPTRYDYMRFPSV